MKKVLALAAVGLSLVGCASTAYVPASTAAVQPLPASQDVTVFQKEDQIKVPYTVVGTINHTDPGKYQSLTLNDVTPVLKEKARAVGANGLIIDKQDTIVSGIFSRGISITARAIKLP